MYYGVRMAIELHAGWTTELDEAQTSIDLSQAPPFLGEMPLLGPALTAAARGDLDRARVAYNRMSPAAGWAPPPELSVQMFAVRIDAAVRIGVRDDLPALLAALEPHRGRHIGTGGGIVTYLGATELWLGIGEGALEQWDAATTAIWPRRAMSLVRRARPASRCTPTSSTRDSVARTPRSRRRADRTSAARRRPADRVAARHARLPAPDRRAAR